MGEPNLAKIVFSAAMTSLAVLPPIKHNSNHILYDTAENTYLSVPNYKISLFSYILKQQPT